MDVDGQESQRRLLFGESAMLFRESSAIGNPLNGGLGISGCCQGIAALMRSCSQVSDWDAYEQLWTYVFDKQLRLSAKEHPLLLCEPAHSTKEQREKLAQLAFEKFEVPALYFGKSPVLNA